MGQNEILGAESKCLVQNDRMFLIFRINLFNIETVLAASRSALLAHWAAAPAYRTSVLAHRAVTPTNRAVALIRIC